MGLHRVVGGGGGGELALLWPITFKREFMSGGRDGTHNMLDKSSLFLLRYVGGHEEYSCNGQRAGDRGT